MFGSLMIAAGVTRRRSPRTWAKALAAYMGHSSITITLDRYGHLLPRQRGEAATLLDSYLAGAETGANRR
jgi:integrase